MLRLFGWQTEPRPAPKPDPRIALLDKWARDIAVSEFPDRDVVIVSVGGIHEVTCEVRSQPLNYWLAAVGFDKTNGRFYRVIRKTMEIR